MSRLREMAFRLIVLAWAVAMRVRDGRWPDGVTKNHSPHDNG